jgi:predicted ribosomally synthesized peptide with nif11-like leader
LCALAAAEGFAFTTEELRAEQARSATSALDDASLDQVAGGICGDSPGVLSGQINPMG